MEFDVSRMILGVNKMLNNNNGINFIPSLILRNALSISFFTCSEAIAFLLISTKKIFPKFVWLHILSIN